jgi:hypothetical protein
MRFLFVLALSSVLIMVLGGCQVEDTPAASATTQTEPIPKATPSRDDPASSSATPEAQPTESTAIAEAQPTSVPHSTPVEETMNDGSGNADVEFVRAVLSAGGSWTFHVTVRHPDTGWEDYADGWDVVDPEGNVLKTNPDDPYTRLLLHPHENEQPFTRSQSSILISVGVSQVSVRAHDLADGYGGRVVVVDLTVDSGDDFKVER